MYERKVKEHIWLSPQSIYQSGRDLHIGAYQPFEDPYCGFFNSLYAAWSWYIGNQEAHLRYLHADRLVYPPVRGLDCSDETVCFLHGLNERRIAASPRLKEDLLASDLPFKAYDPIQAKPNESPVIWPVEELQWYVRSLEQIREYYRSNEADP